jgi:Tol biopolymer transport system component
LACSSDEDGDMDVWIFTAEGDNRRNWTADTTYSEQPAWSPNGGWIAFIRMAQSAPGEEAFFGDVWIGRLDQSEFRQLTDDGLALHPAWSPDGRYVVFDHYFDSTGDGKVTPEDGTSLCAVSVDGEGPFVLTKGPEQDSAADWTW